jgi:hypothetical protein
MNRDQPRFARDRGLTLAGAFRYFRAETVPRLLMLAVVGIGALRAAMWFQGDIGPTRLDLLPLIVLPLAHPFAEWLIHVYILHFRPRTIAGRRLDMHAAHYHRLHHQTPWDLRFVTIPLRTLATGTVIAIVLAATLFPIGPAVTALWVASVLALVYEWSHFLTHTSYRPQRATYKRIWKLHRLHHFKNENYWMGVSRHFGDLVFGTLVDPDAVPTSATARDLDARPAA